MLAAMPLQSPDDAFAANVRNELMIKGSDSLIAAGGPDQKRARLEQKRRVLPGALNYDVWFDLMKKSEVLVLQF
eukprot:1933594-Pyramimonas_sp.AAC.1